MSMSSQGNPAPLYKALADYKSALIGVGCFTALINVLMLAPSIYMLQVYDRVLTSQNQTTLAMLTLMVVGFCVYRLAGDDPQLCGDPHRQRAGEAF